MKIALANSTPIVAARRKESNSAVSSNPYSMDQVQLGGAIEEAGQKVDALRMRECQGQRSAVAGAGVALAGFSALLVGQACAGGNLPVNALVSATAAAMSGVGIFATGIWRRDSANMENFSARMELDNLEKIRDSRFEAKDSLDKLNPQNFSDYFDAQDRLWQSEGNLRRLQADQERGHLWERFGRGIGVGSVLASVGSLVAGGGQGTTGLLIATAATGLAGAAIWAAGHAQGDKAAAAQPTAQNEIAQRQKEVDQLLSGAK